MAKLLVYQMWPLAWDNLRQMAAHIINLQKLGVDAVWLSPIYVSPMADHGYDVADYYNVDQRFGTLTDFDRFVHTAHNRGIKVIMDLVLNHTSTEHSWFARYPENYCWSKDDRPGWRNFFDNGSAWEAGRYGYYLHSFHKKQADLRWFFPDGQINAWLVRMFQDVVKFWLSHGVDGFRLDAVQALNTDLDAKTMEFSDLLFGKNSLAVINAIFGSPVVTLKTSSGEKPLLMAEIFDPTFGEATNLYADNTPVDYVMNMLLKDAIIDGIDALRARIDKQTIDPNFMLDLENHDSPRFTSRSHLAHPRVMELLFDSDAEAICLYQGQELGLKNPDKMYLPDASMVHLDAQTRMRFERGESLDSLRPMSRANARTHYPTGTCKLQLNDPMSKFWQTHACIAEWKTKKT